jgi:hypothetical protein
MKIQHSMLDFHGTGNRPFDVSHQEPPTSFARLHWRGTIFDHSHSIADLPGIQQAARMNVNHSEAVHRSVAQNFPIQSRRRRCAPEY